MSKETEASRKYHLTAKVTEFNMPPIHDGLVLGNESPIGCVAAMRAIGLVVSSPFSQIELDDDIISHILVRRAILRRIPEDVLIDFVMRTIKPLMGPEEILHLDLYSAITVGSTL